MRAELVALSNIPIFSELAKRDLESVSRLMTETVLPDGRALTRQGRAGREFMIIESGTAKVAIDDVVVAHLGPGDFFGELSLITGEPRNATVTTTSEMIVRVLNRREFAALLDENPRVTRKILIAAVKRVRENERSRTN